MGRRSGARFIAQAALWVFGLVANAAQAFDPREDLTMGAFGTLDLTRTGARNARVAQEEQLYGIGRSWNATASSKFGAQLDMRLDGAWSATAQLLAYARSRPALDAQIEWAFVRWRAPQGTVVRLGRTALPLFLVSDSRNVGFSNTWAQTPNEVYGLGLLKRLNGIDVTHEFAVAGANLAAGVLYGSSEAKNGLSTATASVTAVRGLNVSVEYGVVVARVSRVWARVAASDFTAPLGIGSSASLPGTSTPSAPSTASGAVPTTALPFKPNGGNAPAVGAGPFPGFNVPIPLASTDSYLFTSVGVQTQGVPLVLQAEYVTRHASAFDPIVAANAWYSLLGYRFGEWTPYMMFARENKPYALSRLIEGPQRTTSLGLRWDAHRNFAGKLQLERIDPLGDRGVSFRELTPAFDGRAVHRLTVAVDFVFQ